MFLNINLNFEQNLKHFVDKVYLIIWFHLLVIVL